MRAVEGGCELEFRGLEATRRDSERGRGRDARSEAARPRDRHPIIHAVVEHELRIAAARQQRRAVSAGIVSRLPGIAVYRGEQRREPAGRGKHVEAGEDIALSAGLAPDLDVIGLLRLRIELYKALLCGEPRNWRVVVGDHLGEMVHRIAGIDREHGVEAGFEGIDDNARGFRKRDRRPDCLLHLAALERLAWLGGSAVIHEMMDGAAGDGWRRSSLIAELLSATVTDTDVARATVGRRERVIRERRDSREGEEGHQTGPYRRRAVGAGP